MHVYSKLRILRKHFSALGNHRSAFILPKFLPYSLLQLVVAILSIRRQAINVLHDSKRRERVWDSCAAARVAERVMTIEERGLVVSECQDAPSSTRIMLVNQTIYSQTYITNLQFKRAPWSDAAPLEEEMIFWRTGHVSSEIMTPELTSKILRAAGLIYSLSLSRGRFRITHSFYEQLRII
jgi:hypothetical protein